MKKHLPSFLPALALLTLGGCATTSNLATTENDGMYYSAADKVTAVPMAQQGPDGSPGDVVNPDYSGGNVRNGSDEYYEEEDYYAASRQRRFRSPYRGSSLGYYDFSYSDPYFYGAPIIGYSPYGYSPYSFYDPFYRPYYGYGGLTINIGYGFGRPYYRPYGYGYGSGYGYDPYRGYGNSYGGYYGGNYYGHAYNNGYYGVGDGRADRNVTYGARRSRSGDGAGLRDGSNGGAMASPGRSRVVQESTFATPDNGRGNGSSSSQYNGRSRVRDVNTDNRSATGQSSGLSETGSRTGRYRGNQSMPDAATPQPQEGARRWRVLDNSAPANGAASASEGRDNNSPAMEQSGRSRRATYWSGDNNGSQSNTAPEQPQRQRTSERAPTRTYSQPSRSYESPRSESQPSRSDSQPSRSYSQPSRSESQPSRSESAQPSRSYSPPAQSSGGSSDGGGRGRVR